MIVDPDHLDLALLAEGQPLVDFCSRFAFPNCNMCGHTDTTILDMCEHTDKKILDIFSDRNQTNRNY